MNDPDFELTLQSSRNIISQVATSMKKNILISLLFFFSFCTNILGQNYVSNPIQMNAVGAPGNFLLDTLLISNPGTTDITIFINRLQKILPQGWTSCFCFPICMAPWIDTLTWVIPAGGYVQLSPNFQTTLTPGQGTIVVQITNLSSGNQIDTFNFVGSTLSSYVSENDKPTFSLLSNTISSQLYFQSSIKRDTDFLIFDISGNLIMKRKIFDDLTVIDVSSLKNGLYFIRANNSSLQFIAKFMVSK